MFQNLSYGKRYPNIGVAPVWESVIVDDRGGGRYYKRDELGANMNESESRLVFLKGGLEKFSAATI